ncbi:hypothetical protein SAMN06265365_11659 [Tistlia consotensis]|uniref:Uncharacterized protein n=1 Tax=Tistlia consotensis USBA 355 TaxID=560819 RepID=A0A1Y6CD84_9PROT|nr:hypothetical protein [Tistlia consotensis]SMF48372.1 hypothetical protein SAMN05428998_11778 [Tistlia consotensis USBA 355]SNR81335.1 hypothetical protein SAMN06265365_11659 [Tistlia consotensis]
MSLSKRSLETLLDLVEIKLSCMEVWDRDDRRELQSLEAARTELRSLGEPGGGEVVAMPRRRGRPRSNPAPMHHAASF